MELTLGHNKQFENIFSTFRRLVKIMFLYPQSLFSLHCAPQVAFRISLVVAQREA